MGTEVTYFRHVPEHLISSPLLHVPVIVVLFRAANAERSIYTTRPTQESSAANLDLSASNTVHRLGDDIPVCLRVEVLAPSCSNYQYISKSLVFQGGSPSRHMHIFQIGIVGPGLKDQDFRIDVFGEAACDHTSRRSSTVPVNHVQWNPSSTKIRDQRTRRLCSRRPPSDLSNRCVQVTLQSKTYCSYTTNTSTLGVPEALLM